MKLPSKMFGGSSRTDFEMLRVWMKISPAWEVSMWERTLAPPARLLEGVGISSMTDRSLRRKLVRHDECLLLTSIGVTRDTLVVLCKSPAVLRGVDHFNVMVRYSSFWVCNPASTTPCAADALWNNSTS